MVWQWRAEAMGKDKRDESWDGRKWINDSNSLGIYALEEWGISMVIMLDRFFELEEHAERMHPTALNEYQKFIDDLN